MSRVSRGKRGESAQFHAKKKKILVAKFFQYFAGAGGSSGKHIVAAAQVKQNKTKKNGSSCPRLASVRTAFVGLGRFACCRSCTLLSRETCHSPTVHPHPTHPALHFCVNSESLQRAARLVDGRSISNACLLLLKLHLASLKKHA